MGLLVRGLVALVLFTAATPALAECYQWPVDPSISLDGRSILTVPDRFGQAVPFIIANAYLPKPNSDCHLEELRSTAVRAVIISLLKEARIVTFCVMPETIRGYYGFVEVDGRDVAEMLTGIGLAYSGSELPISYWCKPLPQ